MIEWIWFHSTWFYQAKWGDRVLLGWYGYQRKFAILFLFSKGHILCEWTIPCIGTVSRLNLVFVIWWKQHVLGYPLLSVCVWYHSRFTVFGRKMESTLPMSTSQPSIFGLQMPSFPSNLLEIHPFSRSFSLQNVTLPSNSCTSTFLHWNYLFSKKKNSPL